MDLEKLKDKIKLFLSTNDSEYALPFAIFVSKDFNSFSDITTEMLQTDIYLITDYNKKHAITLEAKINEIVNILRKEYDNWKAIETEKYFFEEINTFIANILLSFYEETLDDNSYPSDEEVMDDIEPIKFELSSVVIFDENWDENAFLGEIQLWLQEMHEVKYSY